MARVDNVNFGKIRGRVGDLSFYLYRGKQKVRVRRRRRKVSPFDKVRRRDLTPNEVQFLNRCICFSLLSSLFHKLRWLIWGLWERVVKTKKLRITGRNMFLKYNAGVLYDSIPSRKEYLSRVNMPDLGKVWITYEYLPQPPQYPIFRYESGSVCVRWDSTIWREESPDDCVVIVCVYFPVEDIKGEPKVWRKMKVWTVPEGRGGFCPLRKEGKFCFSIDKGLDPDFLWVWVFFTNKDNCSRSYSCKLLEG